MQDKLVALEEDKCQLVYQLIRASGARIVVEVGQHADQCAVLRIDACQAGTSFGVSTIYLALGVNQNIQILGGHGVVIGTEKEASKAKIAREHWRACGDDVANRIDLREGDLRETLKENMPPVDLLLLDSQSHSKNGSPIQGNADVKQSGRRWRFRR